LKEFRLPGERVPRATTEHTYIWERPGWPGGLTWNAGLLASHLDLARRAQWELQGVVMAVERSVAGEAALAAMAREVVSNSAIEGVTLDLEAVRGSMLLRLGLPATLGRAAGSTRRVDPVVGILAEAAEGWREPLTLDRIFQWHRALFPNGVPDGGQTLPAGAFRGDQPMVVATPGRRPGTPETIHFEAPGREGLDRDVQAFLAWFNHPPEGLNGLLRAGLAHLWFVTLHPMLDGNGRLARTITDLALAQDERCPRRFYSLSAQIMRARPDYYAALQQAQRGALDVTPWLLWFLRQVQAAALDGVREVGLVLARSCFWEHVRQVGINDRQAAVLENLLAPMSQDTAVSNRRYRAITKVSRATASRDLAELANLGLVVPYGESRAASYRVDLERYLPEGFRPGRD
jgi:Fic family protein